MARRATSLKAMFSAFRLGALATTTATTTEAAAGVGAATKAEANTDQAPPSPPQVRRFALDPDRWWEDPVIYFADDDNVYDSDLFELIRNVRRVGTLPVGFVYFSPYGAETAIVENKTVITG